MPATAQQEMIVGAMVAAHPAWHAASYVWKDRSLVLTTASGAEATVAPDGATTFNIVLSNA